MLKSIIFLSAGMLLAAGVFASAGALPLAAANPIAESDTGIVQVHSNRHDRRWQGRSYRKYGVYRGYRDEGVVLRFGNRDRSRYNYRSNWRDRDRYDNRGGGLRLRFN